jgi:hypothetical protein
VVREALMSGERRSLLLARAWRGHFPLIFQTLEGGKRDGALDASIPTPLLVIATAAVGVLPQVAATAVPQLGLVPGEALADRLADLLFDGIAAPHSPAISQGT